MDQKAGKPVTTSVPSIAIKFHANDEQLEEVYASDEETGPVSNLSEPDNSPLKYLPKLVKRSTSIDVSTANLPVSDPSPPSSSSSDPWRFFSDIKGKITKSVEDKLTEIKSRNQESDTSPLKTNNSSRSDSEDLSESSISKTCGLVSTTEGVEMSSDEESGSLTSDKQRLPGLQHRFRLLKKSSSQVKEGKLSGSSLGRLSSVTSEVEPNEVEDALEAFDLEVQEEELVKSLTQKIDNFEVDSEQVVNVQEVSGGEVRDKQGTFFAPVGFVDLRQRAQPKAAKPSNNFFSWSHVGVAILFYAIISQYSPYLAGFLAGLFLAAFVAKIYFKFCGFQALESPLTPQGGAAPKTLVEVQAVKEYQPVAKYEGWINEYPEPYNPETYHIAQTQSVFMRLQGNLLRMSHARIKVPKRAMWNEPELKAQFTHHRIYNLLGAKVTLLPEGLAKKRLWSKKYPICITLNKDQMNFEVDQEMASAKPTKPHKKSSFRFRRHNKSPVLTQRFSKLAEDEDEVDSDSRASSPSPEIDETNDDDVNSLDEWGVLTENDDSPAEISLFLFGRSDRDKEEWFRRLIAATRIVQEEQGAEYLRYMMGFVKSEGEEQWLNAFIGRVMFDCVRDETFTLRVRDRIQRKLQAIKLPYFIEELLVTELSLGKTSPVIQRTGKVSLDSKGLWVDMDVHYEGSVVLTLQTKVNLMKLKNPQARENTTIEVRSAIYHSDVDDSAESSSDDEGSTQDLYAQPLESLSTSPGGATPNSGGKKFIKMVDRIAESKLFQAAAENKFIKKAMEGVSNTDLRLKVELRALDGTVVFNIAPPNSDRIWIGFRPTPELSLSAQPIVGERNITFLMVTNWIERKLLQEFEKVMVIPNMEDFVVPVMTPKLPD